MISYYIGGYIITTDKTTTAAIEKLFFQYEQEVLAVVELKKQTRHISNT